MPKATKKKKEKEADFKKAKLKLGKGKKPASNATDTSFKARSIALPSQKQLTRALADGESRQSDTPTTSSGLTIDDVLVQLRHVNAGVRRENIGHLKEVLSAGVSLGVPLGERHGEVAKVMRGVGALIADDDAGVRKALFEFLTWYLARLPPLALSPYLSLLQLQLSSALSHIFPAIRLDACKLVELLLETHPAEIVGSWPSPPPKSSELVVGSTVFDGLRMSAGLGEEKGASTQGGFRLTAAAKLTVLSAIKTFVHCALVPTERKQTSSAKFGDWTLATLAILPADEQWSLNDYSWALEWNEPGAQAKTRNDVEALEQLSATYLSLHNLLLSTFMEATASAFKPSGKPDETSIDLCSVCVGLVGQFAHALLESEAFESLSTASELRSAFGDFLKRQAAWFPYDRADTPSQELFTLSLSYAQLAALLAPHTPAITTPKRGGWRARVRAIEAARPKPDTTKSASTNAAALTAAQEWVEDRLAPQDALSQLSASAYTELLPVIWSLALRDVSILDPLLAAVQKQQSTSAKRRASDEFLTRLLETHEDPHSSLPLFIPLRSQSRVAMNNWLASVPRTLWELGGRDPAATDKLLRLLLYLGNRTFEAPYSLVTPDSLLSIAGKIGPFFHIAHPTKGGIEGPWSKLGEKEQRLALDVVRSWARYDEAGLLSAAVDRAIQAPAAPEWAKLYWSR